MGRELNFPVDRVEDSQFRAKRRAVVKIALARLAKILGTRQDASDDEVIDAYTNATAFIAPRFVAAAADQILATAEYFPKPVELRKAARELADRERRAEQEARVRQRENPDPDLCPQCLGHYEWVVPPGSTTGQVRYLCPCQRRLAEEHTTRECRRESDVA